MTVSNSLIKLIISPQFFPILPFNTNQVNQHLKKPEQQPEEILCYFLEYRGTILTNELKTTR